MKKAKIAFGLLFIILLGVIIYQNGEFFFAARSLSVDLYIQYYKSPALPTAIWFVAFFLLGWLLAYLSSLSDRFKATKEAKRLQQTIQSQQNDIDAMRKDVAEIKAKPMAAVEPPPAEAAPVQAAREPEQEPNQGQETEQELADSGAAPSTKD